MPAQELTLRPRTVFPALQISWLSISSSSFCRSCLYVFLELKSSDRRVSVPSFTLLYSASKTGRFALPHQRCTILASRAHSLNFGAQSRAPRRAVVEHALYM